jgi:DDE superfamily endonuclease
MTAEWNRWIADLAAPLHGRNRWRLQSVIVGIRFASGRRTVSSWWRASGVGCLYRSYYYFLDSVGRKILPVATALLQIVLNHVEAASEQFHLFAIDDSPTHRFGPKVQGAGYHHNPTPGPAGRKP